MRAISSRKLLSFLSAAMLAATCQAVDAGMVTLDFTNISNNSGQAASVASQLKLIVADQAVDLNDLFPADYIDDAANEIAAPIAGHLSFIFLNLGPIASSICDVYFDSGPLQSISSIFDSGAGVSFDDPATPGDLPGGNSITPQFDTSTGLSADSNSPVSANGVGLGEWLVIELELQPGETYATTLAALVLGGTDGGNADALRIGLHVQATIVRDAGRRIADRRR